MQCREVISIFPEVLKNILQKMELNTEELQEIRIRAGRPVLAVCDGHEYISGGSIQIAQIGEILAYLSNYSLYAYESEVRQGFISLPGGHRVGITGRAVLEQGRLKTLTEISSLNIRFAHEKKGCADSLLPYLWEGDRLCHTLIISAPGQGKTTLLRDCIRQISNGCFSHEGLTIGVVDERSEIAGNFRGIPGNDLGLRTDVLEACSKAEGMMLLIRSMAPEVIAVDEVGSQAELEAMTFAMNCGCVLLATVHGASMEELMRKPVLRQMIEGSMFDRYVFLESGKKPGQIRQVLDRDGHVLSLERRRC